MSECFEPAKVGGLCNIQTSPKNFDQDASADESNSDSWFIKLVIGLFRRRFPCRIFSSPKKQPPCFRVLGRENNCRLDPYRIFIARG
jgi:hypothetical protein